MMLGESDCNISPDDSQKIYSDVLRGLLKFYVVIETVGTGFGCFFDWGFYP